MAKRPRVDLNQVLHYLSDDEWAAEGSDDDSGMDEDLSYFSPSSDEGITTPSHYYKTSTMKAKIINNIHVKIDNIWTWINSSRQVTHHLAWPVILLSPVSSCLS